uniref:Uncharacterized protein n=1 Tax=Solanum tuberosum TaxID=4113 RepID=M1C180_SOLTU
MIGKPIHHINMDESSQRGKDSSEPNSFNEGATRSSNPVLLFRPCICLNNPLEWINFEPKGDYKVGRSES